METHAHHLHHAPGKKFWHYFYEFLMLFLAVFCGFLAENFRESVVEHEREVQYMKSLISDLARDTAFINPGIPVKEERVRAIDSVFQFFETQTEVHEIPGYIAQAIKRCGWDKQYDRNSGTMDQLKNAGGLRLIRKKKVADSIAAYDLLWGRADFWKQNYTTHQQIGYSLMEKIFADHKLLTLYKNNSGLTSLPLKELSSVTINPTYLVEFFNFLFRQKAFTNQDSRFYKEISNSATSLIELVKKEYHIE